MCDSFKGVMNTNQVVCSGVREEGGIDREEPAGHVDSLRYWHCSLKLGGGCLGLPFMVLNYAHLCYIYLYIAYFIIQTIF